MTEKRNQIELLWFQTRGALNFITAAPHRSVASLESLDLAPFANSEGSWSLPKKLSPRFYWVKERYLNSIDWYKNAKKKKFAVRNGTDCYEIGKGTVLER
jgi:hypothetical protein